MDAPMPTDNAADDELQALQPHDGNDVAPGSAFTDPPLAYVLGNGTLQRRIADELGLRVIARPDPGDDTPLVVLAERAPDVQAIAQARAWAPIRAVIAWALPESALLRLLDLELPTLIGLPDRDMLRRAIQQGEDGLDRAAERRRAGRLAAVEAALSTKGRADATLSQLRAGE
jgi:hypothetical protein